MAPPGRRRGFKSLLVEPYRQVKLGLMFLVFNLVFSALILIIFGYYAWDMYSSVASYFQLTHAESSLAMAKFRTPIIVGIGLVAMFIVTTLLLSVKYTHEIYGPLVSIHRFIDVLMSGKRPDDLHLRESDQLQDLANKLNSVAEAYVPDKRQSSFIPVYRFIDDLIAGEKPTPLAPREADNLGTLCEKLNQLSENIRRD